MSIPTSEPLSTLVPLPTQVLPSFKARYKGCLFHEALPDFPELLVPLTHGLSSSHVLAPSPNWELPKVRNQVKSHGFLALSTGQTQKGHQQTVAKVTGRSAAE